MFFFSRFMVHMIYCTSAKYEIEKTGNCFAERVYSGLESITALSAHQYKHEYDLNVLRQRRVHCLHNENKEELEEKQNPIYMESIRFENVEQQNTGRYDWMAELDNKKLHTAIQSLKKEEMEILTCGLLKGIPCRRSQRC